MYRMNGMFTSIKSCFVAKSLFELDKIKNFLHKFSIYNHRTEEELLYYHNDVEKGGIFILKLIPEFLMLI